MMRTLATQIVSRLLEDEEDDDYAEGDMARPPKEGTWRGKPAYIGVADIRDGHVNFARSYASAKSHGWHHTFFLRPQDIDALDNGETVLWFIDERGRVSLMWDYVHPHAKDSVNDEDELRQSIASQIGL